MKNVKMRLINGLLTAGFLTAPVFAEEPQSVEEKKDGFYRRARQNPVDIDRINEIFSTITSDNFSLKKEKFLSLN